MTERFHVRRIDARSRVLKFIADFHRYHDACVAADAARYTSPEHFIVWDSQQQKALYDSRPERERNEQP